MHWIVKTCFAMSNNVGNIKQLIPDTVAIFTVVILLFFGIKVKDEKLNE